MIKIKRIYESADKADGFRILIDRLWPRGISKEKAKLDLWLKEIAPSDSLRKWFGHDLKKCESFKERYFSELESKQDALDQIPAHSNGKTVTLLYGAKEEGCNNATALKEYLEKRKK
jgi:uncharacterized protein YeaO (DUF488 family)